MIIRTTMLGPACAGFAGGQRVGRLVFWVGRSGAWRSGADTSVHPFTSTKGFRQPIQNGGLNGG